MARISNLIPADIMRWVNTTKWSIDGLAMAWKEEKSLRQWVFVNIVSWVAIVVLGFHAEQAALLIALGVLVVIVELLNSAIETCIDYVSTDRHPLAKKAKDIASAAVFVSALLWGGLWVLILFA
ncbi:MAG: diacylglycerol kinase [Paracoccaceae bacterium]|nr:diacylglycerol kinase [Paracoccaceae bacterium]MDG2257741.1 diacylglycerol kinase [Paracoccaceae bacterium]